MDEDRLRLAFVGDVCLGGTRGIRLDASGFTGWPAIRSEVGGHDFLVGNLECCLVDEGCSEDVKRRPMAVPSTAATFLHALGFTDLCLANNHAMDCGPGAVAITRDSLALRGMRGFGVGADLDEAEQAVIADHGRHRVAFLGACDKDEFYATRNRAGVAPLQKNRLGRRVRDAAAQADLVVVTLHADLEFSDVPGRWRQRLSRWLIDQGAHLVIQHHPHVLQGMETYGGGLIAYSLGNFIFRIRGNRYQEHKPGVRDSVVLTVDADLQGASPRLDWRVVPIRIGDDGFPDRVDGPARDEALQRIETLSSLVEDSATHRKLWRQRCRREAAHRIMAFYYALRRGQYRRGARELWWLLARPEDRRWVLGLLSLGYL